MAGGYGLTEARISSRMIDYCAKRDSESDMQQRMSQEPQQQTASSPSSDNLSSHSRHHDLEPLDTYGSAARAELLAASNLKARRARMLGAGQFV
eukprot:g41548.t1